jgi:1-acyl-sn-glycerol-3-phosphate acyltransferase
LLISKNIAIFCILFFWTLCFLPAGLLIVLCHKMYPWAGGPDFVRRAAYFYGHILWKLLYLFLPVQISNEKEAARHAPCIIIANHQSFLDLFLFGAQKSPDFCFLSKSWPYKKLFFFAPIMRHAGYIDVEANSPEVVAQLCQKRLQEGVSLVIFPEGQRSRDGLLGRFHVGAFQLACSLNVPVVPLVIKNSRAVFPVGGKYFCPQKIELELLPALFPAQFMAADLPHRAMMRAAREQYVSILDAFNKPRS